MIRVDKDRAYLLQSKPFREGSLLAYLLTQQHGKINFIVTGAKSSKSGKSKKTSRFALLQPCRPVCLSYQLREKLSKIEEIEPIQPHNIPSINHFMLCQYGQELLLKLLPEQHPAINIFSAYEDFLMLLCHQQPFFALRLLELAIIDFFDGISGLYHSPYLQNQVDPESIYSLDKTVGISDILNKNSIKISGEQLNAFNYLAIFYQHRLQSAKLNYQSLKAVTVETLAQAAQPISAFFIARLLGHKKLKTRNIYRELQAMDLT